MQPNLFPTEQDRRNAIFDYFFIHHDIVLCVSEEYENIEVNYKEEYEQFLENQNKKV
jgi:hypothetical protein